MSSTDISIPMRIAIISGQYMVHLGLQKLIEGRKNIQVISQPYQRLSAYKQLATDSPDVIVIDTETERDIIGGLAYIREAAPKSKVVLLSGFEDKGRVREGIESGVDGVILTVHPPTVMLAVIEALRPSPNHAHSQNRATVSVGNSEFLPSKTVPESLPTVWPEALTERERDVIRLVWQGLSNKDIAYHLSISDSTVRHHLTSIFDKVGVPNRQKLLIHTQHFRATPV